MNHEINIEVPGEVAASENKAELELPEGVVETSVPDAGTAPEEPSESPLEVPDKFRKEDGSVDTDALLRSYTELESKLGQPPPPAPETPTPEADPELAVQRDAWAKEYAETGTLTEESLTAMAKAHNVTPDHALAYLEGQAALGRERARGVFDRVGGQDKYLAMLRWSTKELGDSATRAFEGRLESAMGAGDTTETNLLVDGLKAQWDAHSGKTWAPQLSGNTAAGEPIKPYASEAEAQRVVASKDYQDGDPNVHKMHQLRLARSMALKLF